MSGLERVEKEGNVDKYGEYENNGHRARMVFGLEAGAPVFGLSCL